MKSLVLTLYVKVFSEFYLVETIVNTLKRSTLAESPRGTTERAIKMSNPSEYEKYAQECVSLAQATQVSEHRVMLMHIAETWRRLASDTSAKAALGNGSSAAGAYRAARRN